MWNTHTKRKFSLLPGRKSEGSILFTYAVSTAGIAMAMVNAAWSSDILLEEACEGMVQALRWK
ncbi:MAG: hypothetical protein IKO25_06760 [Clostridia bacterium]|nr:hypothetical protein [Clostridia bacterium]